MSTAQRAVLFGVIGIAVCGALVGISTGCGDEPRARPQPIDADVGSNTRCNDSPLQCPAGETCWFVNEGATEFACRPSGTAQEGEACRGIPGVPSCGDGLVCLRFSNGADATSESQCVRYCAFDASTDSCRSGASCSRGDFTSLVKLPLCLPDTNAVRDE